MIPSVFQSIPGPSRTLNGLPGPSRESKGLLIISQGLPGLSRAFQGRQGPQWPSRAFQKSFRAYQGLHAHVHMNLPGLSKAIQDLQEYSRAFKSNTLPGISRARGDKFIFIQYFFFTNISSLNCNNVISVPRSLALNPFSVFSWNENCKKCTFYYF